VRCALFTGEQLLDYRPKDSALPNRERPVFYHLRTRSGIFISLVALTITVNALKWSWYIHPDAVIAQRAADTLLSLDWYRTYIEVPTAQLGPLSIAMSKLPHGMYVVLVAALSLPFLMVAARGLKGRKTDYLWFAACLGLIVPWSQFAWKGHADDALVLVCAALVVHGLDRHVRATALLTLWAIALLAKPTALVFLPLVASTPEIMAVAGAIFALIWLPFVWASPGEFLHAAKGVMHVSPHSSWGELGLPGGPPPMWIRPVNLTASVIVAAWAMARRAPGVALLLAFTVRSLAEMNPAPSYAASVVAAALLADARTTHLPILLSVPALAAFWTSQPALNGDSGWPRILAHLTLIGLSTWLLCRSDVHPKRARVRGVQGSELAPGLSWHERGRRITIGRWHRVREPVRRPRTPFAACSPTSSCSPS
jgi:hypothetical protein